MEDSGRPRFNFVSVTFVAGFGIGVFLGVALALAAFALTRPDRTNQTALAASATLTPASTARVTVAADTRPRTTGQLDVYLGPGDAYAIIGTIARGVSLQPIGRDSDARWLAISFPPGSTGRGWVPTSGIENLTTVQSLAVVAPTPLARSVTTPLTTPSGDDSSDDGSASSTPSTSGTPSPTATRVVGPDLVITGARVLSDGRVSVTVGNRGAADIGSQTVTATILDKTGAVKETITSGQPGLAPGSAITLLSSSFRVTSEIDVRIVLDVGLTDVDRSNNSTTATLTPVGPQTQSTPTAQPSP